MCSKIVIDYFGLKITCSISPKLLVTLFRSTLYISICMYNVAGETCSYMQIERTLSFEFIRNEMHFCKTIGMPAKSFRFLASIPCFDELDEDSRPPPSLTLSLPSMCPNLPLYLLLLNQSPPCPEVERYRESGGDIDQACDIHSIRQKYTTPVASEIKRIELKIHGLIYESLISISIICSYTIHISI